MLLTEENEQHGAHIQRSMQVYKRMKKDHLFLTSTNDYPLAVLLAGKSEHVETLMDRVERLYQKLATAGLRKGMIFNFESYSFTKEGCQGRTISCTMYKYMEFVKARKGKSKTDALPSYRATSVTRGRRKEIHSIRAFIEKLQGINCSVGIQIQLFLLLFNCS